MSELLYPLSSQWDNDVFTLISFISVSYWGIHSHRFPQIPPSQCTVNGGRREMLTHTPSLMKTNCGHGCLVDVLTKALDGACAIPQRAVPQTSFRRAFQKQDFNLWYTAPWSLGAEVRNGGSIKLLFVILNYYSITSTLMYISEQVISNMSQFEHDQDRLLVTISNPLKTQQNPLWNTGLYSRAEAEAGIRLK